MEKNPIKERKTTIIVKAFIDTELLRYPENAIKKYFRYVHLGNRLVKKIKASKNTLYILKNTGDETQFYICKGKGNKTVEVTIENNELCLKQG